MSVAIDPVGTPCCGQLFCHECLVYAAEEREQCPMDRQPLTFDQVRKIDKAGIEWKRWSEMTVTCQGHELGCDWTGIAKDYEDHAAICHLRKISSMMPLAKRIDRMYGSFIELTRANIPKVECIHRDYDALLQILIRLRQVCETNDEHAILSAVYDSLRSLRYLLDTATSQSHDLIRSTQKGLSHIKNYPSEVLGVINESGIVEEAQDRESKWAYVLKSCHNHLESVLATRASTTELIALVRFLSEHMHELSLNPGEIDNILKSIQKAGAGLYECKKNMILMGLMSC